MRTWPTLSVPCQCEPGLGCVCLAYAILDYVVCTFLMRIWIMLSVPCCHVANVLVSLVLFLLLFLFPFPSSQFALRYGAAVIYNGKDNTNKETVYRYLLHRAYGFPFRESADVSKPEALFIPSGKWAIGQSVFWGVEVGAVRAERL